MSAFLLQSLEIVPAAMTSSLVIVTVTRVMFQLFLIYLLIFLGGVDFAVTACLWKRKF